MKTAGMIGGLGPESTIEYYRLIVSLFREQSGGEYPRIFINCVNLKTVVDLVSSGNYTGLADMLVDETARLARAGADFAMISANMPHIVFDQVRKRSSLPMISIVEEACREAKGLGLNRLGLFGNRFTMRGTFYPEVFSREGMDLVIPEPDDQEFIHDRYMNELVKGVVLDETRRQLLAIASGMIERHKIQGLILGGTELSLILKDPVYQGIPFLDTTRIHAASVVKEMLS